MNDLSSPKDAVEALLKLVPSFASVRSHDESYMSHNDDGPYLVYGDFARFLTGLILYESRGADTAEVLAKSFKLLSELATSSNDDIANIAVVGVFESLAENPDCIVVAKNMLSKDAAKVFNRVLRGWN